MTNPFAPPGQGNSPLTDTMAQMKNESAAPANPAQFSIKNTAKENALIKMRADPNYVPQKSTDPTEWVRRNYGAEWLNPDGSMPTSPKTYTGGVNGQPRIGSSTGISYLPWDNKNNRYDVNGQDYSRPQYAWGPEGVSSGYHGTPEELKAERDAGNFYRNGGEGLDPAMFRGVEFEGLPQDSYTLPNGGVYNVGKGVSRENPMGRDASYSGPGGDWSEDHWGRLMENGTYAGQLPGQSTMEALAGKDPALAALYASKGVYPSRTNHPPGGGGGTPGMQSSNLPWRPGIDGPDPRDEDEDVGRSWNNVAPIPGIPGTGGVGGDINGNNTPAGLDALRRALMAGGNWG